MSQTTIKCNIKTLKIFDEIKKEAKRSTGRFVDVGINSRDGAKQYDPQGGAGAKASVAQVGMYQEFGWVQTTTAKQSRFFGLEWGLKLRKGTSLMMPPRPFLRGTLEAEKDKWVEVIGAAIKRHGLQDLKSALVEVGQIAQFDIQSTIADGKTSKEEFPRRSKLTMAIYAAQAEDHKTDGTGGISGDKPLFKTGVLMNSISYNLREK